MSISKAEMDRRRKNNDVMNVVMGIFYFLSLFSSILIGAGFSLGIFSFLIVKENLTMITLLNTAFVSSAMGIMAAIVIMNILNNFLDSYYENRKHN